MAYCLIPISHKPWVKMTQLGIFINHVHLFRRTDRSKEKQEDWHALKLPVKSILSDAHVNTTTTTRINPIPPIFFTPLLFSSLPSYFILSPIMKDNYHRNRDFEFIKSNKELTFSNIKSYSPIIIPFHCPFLCIESNF